MKKIFKFFGVIIIILIAGLLFLYIRNSARTVYNDENAFGNTAGNLFNGGLFRAYGDKIYFSNINDDGALYSMDTDGRKFNKLSSDRAGYINATGNYIYYSRMLKEKENGGSNVFAFRKTGIFRINSNGSNIKSLYDDPSGLVNVYGNTVYYQHYNSKDGLKFYKVSIDGTGEEKISDKAIVPMTIADNILYYTGTDSDHYIYAMDLATGRISTLYEGNCYAPIVNNDSIYFMSVSDNYTIYRMDLSGGTPVQIFNERCSTYNITENGNYLYYQVDNNKNNRIGKLNLKTGETDTIMKGNYKNINIAGKYLYFMDFEEKEAYSVPIGPVDIASSFNPPKIDK